MTRDTKMLTEETTPQELHDLWVLNPHKLKLRKEIASHPNADQKVLIEASRLYIKEVLNNPSLEFIELFSSEEESAWIRILKFAYSEPIKFLKGIGSIKGITSKTRSRYIRFQNWNTKYWIYSEWNDHNLEKIPFEFFYNPSYCGPLLQATLYGAAEKNMMDKQFFAWFLNFIPNLSDFKRALKDSKVKEGIDKYISKKNKKSDDYENIYMMWISGIISDSDLNNSYLQLKSGPPSPVNDTLVKNHHYDRIEVSKNLKKLKQISKDRDTLISAICIAYRTCQSSLITNADNFLYSFYIKLEDHRDLIKELIDLNSSDKIYIVPREIKTLIKRLIKKSFYAIDVTYDQWNSSNEDFDTYWEKLINMLPSNFEFEKVKSAWLGTTILRISSSPTITSSLLPGASTIPNSEQVRR